VIDQRERLKSEIVTLIDRLADGSRDDRVRDALLYDVLSWQAEAVHCYGRYMLSTGVDRRFKARSPSAFPPLPTDVFRYARVAWHDPSTDRAVFKTSGTTQSPRGSHFLYDLSLYDRAARSAARVALFPDLASIRLLVLAPPFDLATDSSLSYMLQRFISWFGAPQSDFAWRGDALDVKKMANILDRATQEGQPIALLGTSFAFVHAEEALHDRSWHLPSGSRIMQTGGFKGRVREVDSGTLRASLSLRYGIDEAYIIQEYGMTELCSQMYETTLRDAVDRGVIGTRRFWTPGWVRTSVVDPETLVPLSGCSPGLLRIDDLTNLDSVCSIQTSDFAQRCEDGFVLLGRATDAVPRGCSIVWE